MVGQLCEVVRLCVASRVHATTPPLCVVSIHSRATSMQTYKAVHLCAVRHLCAAHFCASWWHLCAVHLCAAHLCASWWQPRAGHLCAVHLCASFILFLFYLFISLFTGLHVL